MQDVNQNTQEPSVIKNAHKASTAKDVQHHAVTTVLESNLSVIMSLGFVTWGVIQDIRVICVHMSALMVSMAMDVSMFAVPTVQGTKTHVTTSVVFVLVAVTQDIKDLHA
ncbi:hypothetical protein RRG08_038366 [Elysia crispata]|uniref:Uncharacterized protein n=1 Tax=Elysia crispata TaxID=231223 RepID=A0AAE1AYE4_9GAST|nr:hypothetical protein RRG08_038366 [Elysia crispata]